MRLIINHKASCDALGLIALPDELREDAKLGIDALAITAADVGIAMGGSTDIAEKPNQRCRAFGHALTINHEQHSSKRRHRAWVKRHFLMTTILGITGLWIAVLADTGASVLITLNVLKLLRFKGH
ncbi:MULTISPECIES: hypothetical protein [Psychrobacter]|uniref:hypothetical protein n=1 Tax=Psychrobacter TaxID=497 RepID=UPI001C616B6B|nr:MULTISPECIES: hypothetical protein [Psychrobacter]